jgi:biopolymer transport protein ExbB
MRSERRARIVTEWGWTLLAWSAEYWRSGGILLAPIAAVCFAILAYYLRTRGLLRDRIREARELAQRLTEAPADASPVAGRGVSSGTERCALICGSDRAVGGLVSGVQRDLDVLSALTAAAPLLGLLGTVMGMMDTFAAVSARGGGAAVSVAGGISEALITTQFGLVVAIPGVFGVVRLRRLAHHLRAYLTICRTRMLAEAPTR